MVVGRSLTEVINKRVRRPSDPFVSDTDLDGTAGESGDSDYGMRFDGGIPDEKHNGAAGNATVWEGPGVAEVTPYISKAQTAMLAHFIVLDSLKIGTDRRSDLRRMAFATPA